jgi:drug/metabolite transporter (DMT)-like permease
MRGEDMSSAESPSSGRLLSAYAAIYLIWGSTYLVIRFAIETIPPFLMSGSRYFVAGALLIAWTWAKGCPIPTFKQWRDGSIAGTLMLFMGTSAITWAEQWVPSSIAALLAAMVPVWLIIFSWVQTRPTWRVFTGLIVGFTGVGLLVANGRGYANEPLDVVGVAVTVGATLCWALGSLFSRRANKTDSAMMTVGIQMSCAGFLIFVFALIRGEGTEFQLSQVSASSWLAWTYLTIFGSLIAFTSYVWLLQASTPARVSTYAFVNPLIAVVLGCTLGAEPFSLKLLASTALIVVAVYLIISHQAVPRKTIGTQPVEETE